MKEEMKIVTEIEVTSVQLECPYCQIDQCSFFVMDLRGYELECDHCGKTYKVHPEADIAWCF